MADRSKTRREALSRFRAAERSGELADGAPDYLKESGLYHRQVAKVEAPAGGGVRSGSRWFIGARAAFLLGYNDGLVNTVRTLEDVAADSFDAVILTLVMTGHARIVADGRDETFEAGDLVFEDLRRPRSATIEFSTGASLVVPRARFIEAIDVPTEQLTLSRRLSAAPLASTVSHQIRFLSQNMEALAPEEFEAALNAAVDVALVLLLGHASRASPPVDHLLKAAKAFIEANARDVDLTPGAMTRALGCSRAALYRSFANAGLTVAAYLRDVRFRYVLQAMQAQPHASISQLAYDSGFAANASDFAKLFKRAYGVTPREARFRLSE